MERLNSHMIVRWGVMLVVCVLLACMACAGALAARRRPVASCVPRHSGLVSANSHAQLYVATEPGALPEYRGLWGCVYGGTPFFFGPLPMNGSAASGAGGLRHEMLTGSVVAYEVFDVGGYGSNRSESRVVVRDLRTGSVLHRVPSGVRAVVEPENVGIGNVVAMVLKSDGAAAWIADDGGVRSASNPSVSVPSFQVVAVDGSGMHELASGVEIDPSSLALSQTATNVGQDSRTIAGTNIYWTEGGKTFSAALN
jgi:hypothetical protein